MTLTDNEIDMKYSLLDTDNYKTILDTPIHEVVNKYLALLTEFYKLCYDNISIHNKQYDYFMVMRGVNTLTNVFNNILFYTRNLDVAVFNTQKGYYLYLEFIEQISNEQHMFLQLSSRDATMCVYKKTLFKMNSDFKKKIDSTISNNINSEFKIITEYTKIFRIIFNNVLDNDFKNKGIYIHNIHDICSTLLKANIQLDDFEKINLILDIVLSNKNDIEFNINKLNEFVSFIHHNTSEKIKKYLEKLYSKNS